MVPCYSKPITPLLWESWWCCSSNKWLIPPAIVSGSLRYTTVRQCSEQRRLLINSIVIMIMLFCFLIFDKWIRSSPSYLPILDLPLLTPVAVKSCSTWMVKYLRFFLNQVQLRPLVDWDSIDNDGIGMPGNALCNPFLCHFEVYCWVTMEMSALTYLYGICSTAKPLTTCKAQ